MPSAKEKTRPPAPKFFATPEKFRRWLEENHAETTELWVGYYRKETGRPSITWPESVDHALCFGWIDGVRKKFDAHSYLVRFTPRKARSTWSAVNLARVAELLRQELMHPAGLAAFERRDETKCGYSYEQRKDVTFDAATERKFRAQKKAWKFFQAQPPWAKRMATWWVVSAKREETRARRLARLIEVSAAGRRL